MRVIGYGDAAGCCFILMEVALPGNGFSLPYASGAGRPSVSPRLLARLSPPVEASGFFPPRVDSGGPGHYVLSIRSSRLDPSSARSFHASFFRAAGIFASTWDLAQHEVR